MSRSKVVLITGGSSGIGLAVAQRFIDEGYKAIITGRNKDKLCAAEKMLGNACESKVFDMHWLDKIPALVQEVTQKHGTIDALINNAGDNQKKPFTEVSDEDFQNIVMTNQTALFVLTREVAKLMIHEKVQGSIVNISSMAAHYGIPKVVSYAASKAAVEGMTKVMAVELSPHGIRINCVAPGFIATPMSSNALNNDIERKNRVLARTPMGRLGEPVEIANIVYFLASEEASFITGETVKADGGNSIGF